MFKLLVTAFLIQFSYVVTQQGCGTKAVFDGIVGGTEAPIGEALIGEWPWMAILGTTKRGGREPEWFCGGTLISDRHVLTAAHCVDGQYYKPDIVRVGDHDLTKTDECDAFSNCLDAGVTQDVGISKITLHPQYRKGCVGPCNDIAVVRLRNSVKLDGKYVQHICLPTNLEKDLDVTLTELYGGTVGAYVAGWGKTDNEQNSGGSNVLKKAQLKVGNDNKCNAVIGSTRYFPVKESMLCAAECNDDGLCKSTTCRGDSGGPLMMSDKFINKWYVVGVTGVGGSQCGQEGTSAKYTNVNHFVQWIKQNMN